MKTTKISRSLRKGSLSIVFIVLVLVAVLVVNIGVSMLSQRYPLNIDLTANKDYTIALSEEYENFVKGVTMPVEIIVCVPEADFSNENYAAAMAQDLSLTDAYTGISESTKKYALQVNAFVESFAALNKNIEITYANPNSVTEFSGIANRFSVSDLAYGDIIVCGKHPSTSGDTFDRYRILKMADIFTLQSSTDSTYSYYGCMDITGSSLAGGLVSGLYTATSDSSVEVAVLGGHNVNTTYSTALQSFLMKNNYTFTQVDNIVNEKIKEETQIAILFAPQNDYTAVEIEKLDAFLKNGGKYGRTLVYLPSCTQPELPLLEEFLAEWGIDILPELAIDEENYYQYPYLVTALGAESKYTEGFDPAQQVMYPTNYRVLDTLFETQGSYTTQTVLVTGEKGAGYPLLEEVPEDWQPSDATNKGVLDLAILSTYQHATSSTSVEGESHVLVLSGDDFVAQEVLSMNSCFNSTLVLNLFNGLSGQNDTITVTIEDKVISTTSFMDKVMNSKAPIVVLVCFVVVIPLVLIVSSLAIWILRKKK